MVCQSFQEPDLKVPLDKLFGLYLHPQMLLSPNPLSISVIYLNLLLVT